MRQNFFENALDAKLLTTVFCCFIVSVTYALFFNSYVMPNFNIEGLSIAERLKSSSFGDSEGYGRYADGIIRYSSLRSDDGKLILRHMPALPVILAVIFTTFHSMAPFLILQSLFFFMSLYCFLIKLKSRFPIIVLISTSVIMTLHPMMVKHFSGVMSDILFSSLLLWVASALWKEDPNKKEFLYVGVLLGLAVYIRESAFPLMVMIGGAYLMKDKKYYLKPVILMTITFVIVLTPWMIRNYIHAKQFIPLTTKSTILFYYYSIPLTTELYAPFSWTDEETGYNYPKLYAVYDAGKQSDSTLIRDAIHNYLSEPKRQVVSMLLKTVALFGKPDLLKPALLAKTFSGAGQLGLIAINLGYYVFHVGVILLGICLSFRLQSNPFIYLPYLIAAQYIQALLFWSESRYLMPFYPFLIILALAWWWNKRNTKYELDAVGSQIQPPRKLATS